MTNSKIEKMCLKRGFSVIAGVDEVGRGALFGPVAAVALSFPPDVLDGRKPAWFKEIDDSKLLSATKRMCLARDILGIALCLGVGMASNCEIDQMNIHQAAGLAMKRAVADMTRQPDMVLVDGFPLKDVNYTQMGIRRGDKRSVSIAAASVVAKVLRDGLMDFFDTVYRGYGLAKHKGYGTTEHYRLLREKGATFLHRQSFNLGGALVI